mmetsp:Transcript_18242/g.49022  ORF Transcript_18242/g.49022 Transcript_18242/m.49022 type:complete len:297 (-) Transcript_18242:8-898(-)
MVTNEPAFTLLTSLLRSFASWRTTSALRTLYWPPTSQGVESASSFMFSLGSPVLEFRQRDTKCESWPKRCRGCASLSKLTEFSNLKPSEVSGLIHPTVLSARLTRARSLRGWRVARSPLRPSSKMVTSTKGWISVMSALFREVPSRSRAPCCSAYRPPTTHEPSRRRLYSVSASRDNHPGKCGGFGATNPRLAGRSSWMEMSRTTSLAKSCVAGSSNAGLKNRCVALLTAYRPPTTKSASSLCPEWSRAPSPLGMSQPHGQHRRQERKTDRTTVGKHPVNVTSLRAFPVFLSLLKA